MTNPNTAQAAAFRIHLAATVENTTVRLSAKEGCPRLWIRVLGTTMPCSIPSGTTGASGNDVIFYPEKAKDGLIALAVSNYDAKGSQCASFSGFLKLTWKAVGDEMMPYLDLANPWFPIEQIGHVGSDHVETLINGMRYGASDNDAKLRAWQIPQHGKVVHLRDMDIVVSYLFGTASEDDVIAAVEVQETLVRREAVIASLRTECENMKTALGRANRKIERKDVEIARLERLGELGQVELSEMIAKLEAKLGAARTWISKVKGVLEDSWMARFLFGATGEAPKEIDEMIDGSTFYLSKLLLVATKHRLGLLPKENNGQADEKIAA